MPVDMENRKCKAILDAARELFWKYGFRRVSIDEICRAAGTSKMTFYKFFANKLEVARAVYDMVISEGQAKLIEIIQDGTSPHEKMKKILQLKLEGSNNISKEFLDDFYSNPDLGLSKYIDERTKQLWEDTVSIFRDGQKDGWIRKDMNLDFMFALMQRSTGILNDPQILELFTSPQELVMELASMFAYGISPVKE